MAGIATGSASNLIAEVVKFLFHQIKRPISYVFLHEKKVKKLEKKLERLKDRKERVQAEVDAAQRNGEKIHSVVNGWMIEADKIINAELKEVKDIEDKAKNKCFIGLCPNFKSRYQLSKKAEEEAKIVDELLQRDRLDKVSYRDVLQPIAIASPTDFEAFDSRKQEFNEILEALKDPSINSIGVYGMGGVGKTTLVKEVARQVKNKLFDSVAIAAVTHTPDIQKIQDQIADILGLKFEEQSMTGRASRLCERLKQEKKILVVLDDIWKGLDLMQVGIPFGDGHRGCTVLLTSRELNVLLNGKDVQKKVQIDLLSQEEAWDLFKKTAGNSVENPDLRPIATEIAKKCDGLPIAISTVATTLRDKDSFEWRDALRQLNKPSSHNFGGITAAAYSALEFSYSQLESEELKQTFLLCSLLGHNAFIQDLLKYAMGLGLFDGVKTLEETRDRLLTVVSRLKASCLLLDSYNNLLFDMHDLICDVAISIASRDNRVFALRHGDVLKDWPDEETMKECDKISLRLASNSKLPDQLKCPKLRFFYMKDPSMKMPANFFEETESLKVLDLTKMQFPSLPSSICLLANLRTLCLDRCVLGDIAIIGELKNLEILSFVQSDIERLPKEIGQLTKLKMLDISHCTRLKIIPPNVLSSLSRLEELCMGNSFSQWEVEENLSQRSNASLAELKALSCLTSLDVHIPNTKIIPKDLFFEKLQRYKIFIGEEWDWKDWLEFSRTLKLKLHTSIGHLGQGMKMLLMRAENVRVNEMEGLEILLHKSEGGEWFQQLKNLCIQNGALIQYIIKDNDVGKIEFAQLQSLTLDGLPRLISFCSQNNGSTSISPQAQGLPLFNNEKIGFPKLKNLKLSSISIERIWQQQLPRGSYSFQNLTSMVIEGCGNLKYVLSYSVADCLQQLQCLEIIDCNSMQEIMFMEEIEEEEYGSRAAISFPQLSTLKLEGLQKLIGFCHHDYIVDFQSLKILKIKHCPLMKGFTINKSKGKDINTSSTDEVLFNKKVVFPNLEKMTISHLRNVKRIWYNQLHGDSFSNLRELKVGHCDELLNILSSFLLGVFKKLEILTVDGCVSLEEVFEFHGLEINEASGVAMQLRELHICRLPKLKHVWNKDPCGKFSFQNLRAVAVAECGSLKSLFPFSIAKGLLHLETLMVESSGVEEIVSNNIEGLHQEIRFEFNHLSFLHLWNLLELRCFYPGEHTTVWPILKKLRTYKCERIKIFGQRESQIQQPLFLVEKVIPQLEEVFFNSYDIAMICDGQFAADLFGHIKILGISRYLNESAIFPFSFLQRFSNLEMLVVGGYNFKELSPYEGDVVEEKDMIWGLPKIKKLKLDSVDNITYLWKQGSQLDHICASLETLEVWNCDSLINLALASSSFHNLTTLDVCRCKRMAELIASSKAQSLVCLVTMSIRECEMMTEIVASEGDEATCEIIFRELKCLELHCLKSLKSFCSGNHTFKFPSLGRVIVSKCPRLKSFGQGPLSTPKLERVYYLKDKDYERCWAGDLNATIEQLYEKKVKQLKFSEFPELMDIWNRNPQEMFDFKNLEFLEVCDSNNLRCIFSVSMAMSLRRLQQMEIKRCNKMEQLIKEAEDSVVEEATTDNQIIIIFPRLKSIFIESCSDLTSFYLGSPALECPSLEQIKVAHCSNMTTSVSEMSRDKDKEAVIGDGTERNKDDPDTLPVFLCNKVVFPMLKKLHIHGWGNLKKIWHDQVAADSFCKLEVLQVQGCHKLLHVFPFNMSGKLHRLKQLAIVECDSLEDVFEPQTMNVEESYDMATTQSNMVEVETTTKFVFPQVKYLALLKLPNLKSFYHKMHTTEWPSLKRMRVQGCDKVEIFASEYQNFQNTIGQSQLEIQIQPPLFLVDKVTFPCLEKLRLEWNDIKKEIWHGRFLGEFFCGLKILELIRFPHKAASLSYCFIQSLPNLEKLVVSDASFTDIFHCEGLDGEENHALALARLSELRLSNLPELTDIWDEEFQTGQAFYNLRILEVQECGKLKILVPSFVSFQNLTSLVITRCNGLINLFTHSTAKSLVQLTTMRIIDCKRIEEIIACTSDEVKDGIIFTQLKHLGLSCLPNLSNFCSGNYAIDFPSLEEVVVEQCPKMMVFCRRELSTPKLQGVKFTEGND